MSAAEIRVRTATLDDHAAYLVAVLDRVERRFERWRPSVGAAT